MMEQRLKEAVYAIPVPPHLEGDILAACRRAALTPVKPPVTRYIPAVATAAACVAVLGVTLLTTGNSPGQLPAQLENSAVQPHSTTTAQPSTTMTDTTTTVKAETTATVRTTTRVTSGTTASGTAKPSTTVVSPQSTTANIGTKPTMGGSMQLELIKQLGVVAEYETMTDAELEAYYGRRILPTYVPDGLERRMTDGGDRGIFRRNEEKIAGNTASWNNLLKKGVVRDDQVVFDRTLVTYSDFIDGRRELTVGIATAPYPRYNLGDLGRFDETLTVAGVPVKLARYDDAPYSAEWSYTALTVVDGVEYLVEAWNIPEEEFLAILASLLT